MKTTMRFSTFLIFGFSLCITTILYAAAPSDPTGFGATPGNTSVTLDWTNPGVFDEIMIVASTASFVAVPSGDGTTYTADAAYGSGTAFGAGFVVYEGTGTSVIITGLTNGTPYFFKIFARGGTGSAEWSSGVEVSATPLPQPTSAGTFPQTCIDSGTASWTNPTTVDRILVFAKNNDDGAITVGSPTVAASSYTANSIFGSGDPYENDTDAFCVFSSTSGNSVDLTALTANKTYNFLVFNVDGSAYSSSHTFSGMTRTTVANVTGFGDTPGDSQIALNWTNPTTCFDEMIIAGKLSSLPAITGAPTGDGTAYTGADLDFSSAPAPDFDAAAKLLYQGSTSPQTITGLVNGTGYDFKIWVRRGTTWSSGSTTTGTPVDLTAPLVTAFSPANNGTTSVSTTSLVITFDEPVNEIDLGPSDNTDRIRLFENGGEVLVIDRNDSEITNSGNQITIDISAWPLKPNSAYYVLIGNSVIEDDPAGNNFAGIASPTTWNWSTTGTTVTPPANLDICENSPPRTLGDIVIEEGGDSDFSTAGSITLTLNPASGFVFQAGQGSVTFEPVSGNDIASITVNSITFSSITFSYTLDGVNDERDRIRISGLKVSSDGTTPTTDLERTGGTAVMVGNSVADNNIHATINSGVGPAAPGSITTNPTPFTVCEGASLTGVNVTVGTGTSSLKWYSDAALTTLIGGATGNANPSAAQLGLSSATPGSFTVYVTQTTTCESAGTPVTFTVNPTPVADAGTDDLFFCSDEVITLGGAPTLTSPSVPGPYTYTWTELTGAPVTITPAIIPSTPNPQITVTNTSGSLQNLEFMVTISDANGCVGTDTKDLSVRNEVLITLTSPTSTNFSSAGAPQPLAANPPGGVFSGEGVVQTSPTNYSFDPSVAYQNDPTVPRSIPIYYSVTDANGCTVSNKQITSLTLTNSLTFGTVAAQYCSNEYPSGNGVELFADGAAETSVNNRVNSWNSTGRLGYFPSFNPNQPYNIGDRVRHGSEIYQANSAIPYIPIFLPAPPPPGGPWTLLTDFMKVKWNGMIRNYYEGYFGGNTGSPTIIKLGSTYASTVGAGTLNKYGMRTNPNYVNSPTYNIMYPATYVEFINPAHIIEILPLHYPGGYYNVGNVVKSGGSVYRALLAGYNPAPPNATYWQNVTNSNWDNGNYFHVNDGGFRSGFYHNGQSVTVNKNPTVSFSGLNSGLPNSDDFCNATASFVLSGSVASAGNFSMNFNGGSFGTLPGLTNNLPTAGRATFDPGTSYTSAVGSGIKTFGIKYSFDPGTVGSSSQACSGEEVQYFDIHPLPDISYTGSTPPNSNVSFPSTLFCYAGTPVDLAASETINVQYTGLGVTNVAGGVGKFNPNQAYLQREVELGSTQTTPQSFNVVVTYKDAIGCTNTDTRTYQVQPLPLTVFTYGPKKDFCYAEAPIPFESDNTSGRYEIFYVREPANPNISIVTHGTKDYNFDPSDIFDLAVANGADPLSTPTFRVVFTTNDPVKTSCTNTQVEQFTVAPQIPASIAGVQDLEVYCANEGTRVLTMNPPNGTFRLNGNIQTLIGGTTFELNQEPNGGDFELSYVVSTGTGCTTSITKNIKILPSPVAQFTVPPKCKDDEIDFISLNNVNAAHVIWDFGVGDDEIISGPVGTYGSTTHKYATNGINNVVLTLSAAEHVASGITCTSVATQDVVVGALPISEFSVSKVCEDEDTEFIATTTNGVNLATVGWDFGDGDLVPEGNNSLNIIPAHSNGGRTTGTYGNPVHKYVTSGSYPVQMLGRTSASQGGCLDYQSREVSILTNVTPTPDDPYFMKNLNGENGLWVPEDKEGNSTWAFGNPSGTTINSSELAWATNPAGVYLEEDQSYVNSPCFDMSAFERPVIAISHWANTHPDDGAVLQYSVDGGQSWLVVGGFIGDIATGLDWFNAQGIASAPGGQSNVAWARENQANWLEGKHSLDFISVSQRNQVRFRVAFASRQRSPITKDGFAFNDVKIEERNRTILVENFTNNTVSNAQANNQSFLTFKDGSSTAELVKLQYHIGLPTADNINKQNPSDLNARAAFYGLTNSSSLVPKGYMDGSSQGNFLSNWVESYFSLRSLVSSPLKIQVTSLPSDPDKFALEATIEATSDITQGRLSLFIAVIEKTVGSEGFVVRKILPSAAGTELQLPMLTGNTVTISPTPWEVINAVNPQELAVVAFVQDIETHDVLQATLLQNPANLPTQITGIENESVITDQISFYPNPVDNELTLQLPYSSQQDVFIKLADPVGKIVYDNSIPAGENSKTINTRNLPGGIYLLQVESGKENIAYRKVMIVHNR